MIEAEQPQRDRIEHGQDQAKRALSAHESADGVIDLAGKRPHRLAARRWDPVVDCRNHPVPVIEQIAGNDRGHDAERKDGDQGASSRPDRTQESDQPAARERRKLAD